MLQTILARLGSYILELQMKTRSAEGSWHGGGHELIIEAQTKAPDMLSKVVAGIKKKARNG